MLDKVLTPEAEAENEWIAGVPRASLFEGKYWTGFKRMSEEEAYALISQYLSFRPRNEETEKDESFKQIIPYFLVRENGSYFTSVRKTKGGDARLHGRMLIGFGGHLRKEDIKGEMHEWLQREFEEEIDAEKIIGIHFHGILNDDSDAGNGIGKVHFGLVFIIDVEGNVHMKEEEKFEEGEFMNTLQLQEKIAEMEPWSALVVSSLE